MPTTIGSSIVLLGRYVEISSGPEGAKARSHIRSLLRKRPLWWQSGYTVSQVRRQSSAVAAVYYCILIEKMTGLRGSPDTSERKRRSGTTTLSS